MCDGGWVRVPDVPPQDDMGAARARAAQLDLGAARQWKADRSAPGNGVTRVGLVCSAHVGCTFKLLIKRTAGAFVCFSKGAHAAVSNEWKRSNSKLTKEQESFARKSLSTGAKPAEILAALTGDLLDEGKAKGTPPPKRAEGGLEGVYAAVNADGALNTYMYARPVFCARHDCILTSQTAEV